MNVQELIEELYSQKEKLGRAIALLEELAASRDGEASRAHKPEKRGRKSMGTDERREVSQRMKKYWAAQRKRHET